jgi:hypothetical protein
MASVIELAGRLSPISLESLNESAALQTRIDRKYVVDAEIAEALLVAAVNGQRSGHTAVLEVDSMRTTDYETVYFDTDNFDLHRDAAHSRRGRFKVRTRRYSTSDTAMLEIKTKSGRGETVKTRHQYPLGDRGRLTAGADLLIDDAVGRSGAAVGLRPVLATTYQRITLHDRADQSRLTIDLDVVATDWRGEKVGLAAVVLESKSAGSASGFDRQLWLLGVRPVRFSKYCTSLAALHPHLPSNKWHRTLQRHYVVS